MLTLLVYGYIRELDALLTEQQIIPEEIKTLCYTYYHSNSLLLYIESGGFNKLKLTFNEFDQNDIKSCNFTQIFESNVSKEETKPLLSTKIGTYFDEYSAVICKKNMKLPSNILNTLQIESNNIGSSYDYNVIFKCGYYDHSVDENSKCKAFIYNAMDMKHQMYQWTLPNLPKDVSWSTSLAYSHKYGLFTIGGENMHREQNQYYRQSIKNIYNLSLFDNDEYKDDRKWKFKAKLDYEVGQSASCIINNDKQIFIVGGVCSGDGTIVHTKKIRIFNMETDEIMSMISSRYARKNMGIYYDKLNHNVYVGGGDNCGPMNKVEYFDLNKNICIRMANTNSRHGNYTILWKQYNNHNILNIASNIGDTLESIDLRDNSNKWNVVTKLKISYQARMVMFQD